MNIRRLAITIAAVAATTLAGAQDSKHDDFGIDLSIEAEKKLAKGLDLSLDAGFRTQDDTEKAERVSLGATLSYKFISTKTFDMKAHGGFEYMWCNKLGYQKEHLDSEGNANGYNKYESYWRNRHRTSLGLSAAYSPNKRWTFSLKETLQYNHFCTDSVTRGKWRYNDDDELYLKEQDRKFVKAKDKFVLRSKLAVEYDIKGLPIDPYASIDYGCGLNYNASKWKFTVGYDFKINKRNKLSMFYRYQTENDDDEPDGHIVGWSYKFKF